MIDIASKWQKTVEIKMVGGIDNYNWINSLEFNNLQKEAQKLSPNNSIYDRRTKAYRYMKWHEPRARSKWASDV